MNRIKNRFRHLDQFYTSKKDILSCITDIQHYCPHIDYIIDSSCGNNLFAQYMNKPYQSYDIDPPPKYIGNIYQTNFLNQHIVLPQNCLMGFNPPFGWRSQIAKQFLHKILYLRPRYIAIILLEPSTTCKWQFTNYNILLERELYCHVPCRFFILETKCTNHPIKSVLPRKSTKYKMITPYLFINRSPIIMDDNVIFVRYTGVNAGLEYYIKWKHMILHVLFSSFKTNHYKIVLKDSFIHKVASTTFTKIYYPFQNYKQIRNIILYLHEHSSFVMNLKSIRYNFTTFDVACLVDNFLKN